MEVSMLKETKKVRINFAKGCAIMPNLRERPLYVDKKGIWYRPKIKKVYLNETNCVII